MAGTNLEIGNRKRPGRRLGMRSCSLSILLVSIWSVLPGVAAPVHASPSILVTSNSDLPDLFPGDGSCETVEGKCTLRAAIEEANSDPDHDVIEFAGPMTILVFEALPQVTGPATIDGGGNVVIQEGGWVGTDDVWVKQEKSGLSFAAPAQVRNLTVRHFGMYGIRLGQGSDGSVVEGTRLEHNRFGINVGAPGIRVGSEAKPNYIVGGSTGVIVEGAGARIEGNSVKGGGPSFGSGILVSAPDVVVIGNDIEERGGGVGVFDAARVLVMDNRITGNENYGISVGRSLSTHLEGNVVAANGGHGIVINYVEDVSAETATVVEGNQIGSMVTGEPAGNGGDGIVVMASHTRVIRNSIRSSGGHGVKVSATGVHATTNVLVQSNVIGGSGGGNQLAGIALLHQEPKSVFFANARATAITILSNSIVANGGLPIDLGADGRTENDPLDGDTGPNNRQNTPEVRSVKVMGPRVLVTFRLDSAPLSTYTVELFASSDCAAGEPARSLGFASIRTDGAGSAVAQFNIKASLADSEGIVATATSASGDTSEVSACRPR